MSENSKRIDDLLEIVHFTRRVAAKIRGIPDEEKLVTIATKEFSKSKKYDMVIFFLTDKNRQLRIAGTDIDPKIIQAGEKAGKRNMHNFRVPVQNTRYLKQVIQEKRTVRIQASELTHELFPPKVADIFITAIGYEKDLIILTPLKRRTSIVGILATISSQLTDEFIPSVENLAQHISNALERSEEYIKLKKAQEEINKLNQYLESIIVNADVWLNVLDEHSQVMIWNKAAERISGYSTEEVVGHAKIWEWLYPESDYRQKITEKAAAIIQRGESVEDFETTIQRKDGQKRVIAWNSRSLANERGVPTGSIALGRDITEHKQAQAQLQKSLKDKELLLKEIHHRVNTNMQVVSALLSLQSRYIRDPKIRQIFKQGQSRIRALALIHEKLYQSGDLTCLGFSLYIRDLAIYLFQTYKVNPQEIRLNIQAEDIRLDINTAIPCGLILNELISNALQHAFPQKKGKAVDVPLGELRIRFTGDTDNTYTMMVSDNGIGLQPEVDLQNTESLGLQLVNMLSSQLKSTVEIKKGPGTTFTFKFQEKIDELYVY
ncbi:MAG: PAS domain S-box protein [Candidatus Aminicenantes bacterium]|nr:PAS domain S-box protein [Candidatus Aminicenantes bacterium]